MANPFDGLNDAFGTEPSELQKHVEKIKPTLNLILYFLRTLNKELIFSLSETEINAFLIFRFIAKFFF